MSTLPPPFPDRLRRRDVRRRLSRWLLLPLGLAGLTLVAPAWRITEVALDSCPGLPAAVPAGLADLVGGPVIALDLGWVRQLVGCWPAVAGVDVRVELPGTLRVVARSAVPAGSTRRGDRWLVVDGEGRPAGFSAEAVEPVLERCPPSRRREALAVARRLEVDSGVRVHAVRWILPDDLRVTASAFGSPDPVVVHVAARATDAERWWTDAVSRGEAPAVADLRRDHRVVVGGGGA